MTYHPMRFDPAYRPFVDSVSIYVLPLSADPTRYRVLSPSGLHSKLLDLAVQDKLSIRQYRGCPPEAASAVKEELLRFCGRGAERYATRLERSTTLGVALAALGVINLVVPDPLPVADELLMILGGGALAWSGLSRRRRNLLPLRAKAETAEERLRALAPVDDALVGRIFAAVKARTAPELPDPGVRQIDLVEAEAAWLVEHLDLRSVVADGEATPAELRELREALEDGFPLGRVRVLERRLRANPRHRATRRALDRLAERCGISREVLGVYGEFSRIAAEILEE
ncbi:MAG: hypothetical protein JW820_17755 [Spirochaetales bacterium]|nr:hypothetical protein [Spirochaetales bacterium]